MTEAWKKGLDEKLVNPQKGDVINTYINGEITVVEVTDGIVKVVGAKLNGVLEVSVKQFNNMFRGDAQAFSDTCGLSAVDDPLL